jgi:tetratricopeptide (TPR) repeat protein
MTRILLFAAVLFVPAAAAFAGDAEPFEGKTLEEIEKLIEKRMEDRKEDREVSSAYKSFFKREENRQIRTGIKLATAARTSGEYLQADYLFRFGQHTKSLDMLMKYEKKVRKNRRRGQSSLLASIYLLMAADYAYLREPTKAAAHLRQVQNHGAIGPQFQAVQKKLLELPTRLRELEVLKSKRDLSPRGGKEKGGHQWALCAFYAQSIYLPVEEAIELEWMIETFPEHSKVKSGDAAWQRVRCALKLADDRQAIQYGEKFRRRFPNHWACTQGDVLWALARAYYAKGSLKDARRTAEQLKSSHPKFRPVETRQVDRLIRDCEAGISKDRFSQGNPWNQWSDW